MTDSTEKAEVFDAAWGTEECILFFKSSCCKVVSAARNLINSVLQAAETTFAFSSVFSLLLRYVACKLQTANPRSASSIVAYNTVYSYIQISLSLKLAWILWHAKVNLWYSCKIVPLYQMYFWFSSGSGSGKSYIYLHINSPSWIKLHSNIVETQIQGSENMHENWGKDDSTLVHKYAF